MKKKIAEKAIFLDRDDTIIFDSGYINNPDQVKLIPGAAAGLVELRKMGFKLVIVSNQSGVARGIFTENTLAEIHERLKELLAVENASIDKIYYCPYYKQGSIPEYRKDSDERKPKPGMLLRAAKEMGLDLKDCWMIGDSYNDVAAGKSAGSRTILIKSHTNRPVKNLTDPDPDFKAINLKEAANIVKRELSLSEHKNTQEPQRKLQLQQEQESLQQEPISQRRESQPPLEREPLSQRQEPQLLRIEPQLIENKPAQSRAEIVIETKAKIPEQKITPPPPQEQTGKAAEIADEQKPGVTETEKEPPPETGRTEQLLEEIKHILKSRSRQDAFDEFSAMKLVAGILQMVVLACVFVAILYRMSPQQKDTAAFTAIGFAIVFQLMALTFYIMHNDRK